MVIVLRLSSVSSSSVAASALSVVHSMTREFVGDRVFGDVDVGQPRRRHVDCRRVVGFVFDVLGQDCFGVDDFVIGQQVDFQAKALQFFNQTLKLSGTFGPTISVFLMMDS